MDFLQKSAHFSLNVNACLKQLWLSSANSSVAIGGWKQMGKIKCHIVNIYLVFWPPNVREGEGERSISIILLIISEMHKTADGMNNSYVRNDGETKVLLELVKGFDMPRPFLVVYLL